MSKDHRYERPNRGEAYITDRGKNSHRFRSMAMKREPLSSEVFDMEINYLIYALNEINKGKNPLNPPRDSEGKLVWIGHDSKEIRYDKLGEHMVKEGGLDAKDVIKDHSIKNDKLADDSIDTHNLVKDAVIGDKIKDGSVPFSKMTGEIQSDNIAKGAVKTDTIADKSITQAKIADKSITGDKIAETTIPFTKMTGQIKTENISNAAITGDKIANNMITSAKIAPGSINNSHVSSINGSKIQGTVPNASTANYANSAGVANTYNGAITPYQISGTIPGSKVGKVANATTADYLSTGAILTSVRRGLIKVKALSPDKKTPEHWVDISVVTHVNGKEIYGDQNYKNYLFNQSTVYY